MRALLANIFAHVLELADRHQPTLQKCYIGLGSLFGGFTLSLALVKEWLQVASLVIGCAVGIATFVSILRKNQK
jgi:hypothetical protein